MLVFSFQFSVFSKEGEGWPARPTDFGRGSGTGGSRISRGKRKSSLRRKKGKSAGPAVQPYLFKGRKWVGLADRPYRLGRWDEVSGDAAALGRGSGGGVGSGGTAAGFGWSEERPEPRLTACAWVAAGAPKFKIK